MDKTLETVGHLLSQDMQRDAVHFALAPVVAVERLLPGQHVGLVGDTEHIGDQLPYVGIVDPFLTSPVVSGERCWLFLYPATITSLRHEWTHPAFLTSPQRQMTEIAHEIGMTYQRFMEFLGEGLNELEYGALSFGSDESAASYCNGRAEEIWDLYGQITGRPATERPYFSCAC